MERRSNLILLLSIFLLIINNSFGQTSNSYLSKKVNSNSDSLKNISKRQNIRNDLLHQRLGKNIAIFSDPKDKYYFQVCGFTVEDINSNNNISLNFEVNNKRDEFFKLIKIIQPDLPSCITFKLRNENWNGRNYFALYDQYYKGIIVKYGTVGIDYGITKTIGYSSFVYDDINVDTKNILPFETLFQKYKKQNMLLTHNYWDGEKELIIYNKCDNYGNNVYEICWHFVWSDLKKDEDHFVYLNAKNGKIFFEKITKPI